MLFRFRKQLLANIQSRLLKRIAFLNRIIRFNKLILIPPQPKKLSYFNLFTQII